MTTIVALAAVALLFVLFGRLAPRAAVGPCRSCSDEDPVGCARCPLQFDKPHEEVEGET